MTKSKEFHICDIIRSVPWECGDGDCKQQWHLANYWYDSGAGAEAGYTIDRYADGDHEFVEKNELPSPEEEHTAWLEYARYVATHGIDPLSNYMVKHSRKISETWQFRFGDSILGVVLLKARRAGKDVLPANLPDHVKKYLNLDKGNRALQDFPNSKKFENNTEYRLGRWETIKIEHDQPRPAALITKELKQLARKHLREKK